MRHLYVATVALTSGLALAAACSSANFGASTANPSKTDTSKPGDGSVPTSDPNKKDPKTIGDTGTPPPGKCAKDKVDLKLSTPQEDCIVKQGKTWNFKKGECGNMPAASFSCDWKTVIAELGKFNPSLVTPTLEKSSTDGSKLVTCGASVQNDATSGGRYLKFAVQFISAASGAAEVDCEGTPASTVGITTGCYIFAENAPGKTIPPAGTPDYDKYVYDCINDL